MKAWLKLFRVVNLPTVPGDVFVGAAAVMALSSTIPVWWAAAASVFLYAFGLVDNDIVGAKTDKGRPIPDGEISLGAARVARGLCLLACAASLVLSAVPPPGSIVFFLLAVCCVVYNRTKGSLLMGLCRGLNVAAGGVAAAGTQWRHASDARGRIVLLGMVALWTLYIAAVTKYSQGEENDPEKKRRVGMLVGGIVYLQLTALIVFALLDARTMPLMVAGAVLLILLRILKRLFPWVNAS